MDGKFVRRPLEYELIPFAGGAVERITVVAEHRALGFSLAAAKAGDPNDVWKVRLLSDDGRMLDPHAPDSSEHIPLHHDPEVYEDQRLWADPRFQFRNYNLYFDLFGHCEAREGVTVAGRWNAFTAAALASEAVGGNDVFEIWHSGVDVHDVDRTKKYGGVTLDLNDRPCWIWKTRSRRPSP